jgi:carboxypeptidase PM20D1
VVSGSRYFQNLSSNIFRFLPLRLDSQDLTRMHGTDERIAVADYEEAVRLYRQLILDVAGDD